MEKFQEINIVQLAYISRMFLLKTIQVLFLIVFHKQEGYNIQANLKIAKPNLYQMDSFLK